MRSPSFDFAAPAANGAVQFSLCSLLYPSFLLSEYPHSAVQLQRNAQGKLGFSCFRQLRWAFKRSVQPREKVAVDEQLMPHQGREIRKRPAEGGHQLQVAQDQHSDQRRPDLSFDSIGICPEEGFNLQALFDGFEKQFNLPAVLVDGCDGFRGKVEVVCQEGKRSLAFLVPNLDNSEEVLTVGNSLAIEEYNLILQDRGSRRNMPIFHHFEGGVIFQARDEVDALTRQLDEPLVINVAPVHDYDRASLESEPTGDLDVTGFSVGDHGKL